MHKQNVSIVLPEEDVNVKFAILPETRANHPTQLQRMVYRSCMVRLAQDGILGVVTKMMTEIEARQGETLESCCNV